MKEENNSGARAPIEPLIEQLQRREAGALLRGLADVADGRVRSLDDIDAEKIGVEIGNIKEIKNERRS